MLDELLEEILEEIFEEIAAAKAVNDELFTIED